MKPESIVVRSVRLVFHPVCYVIALHGWTSKIFGRAQHGILEWLCGIVVGTGVISFPREMFHTKNVPVSTAIFGLVSFCRGCNALVRTTPLWTWTFRLRRLSLVQPRLEVTELAKPIIYPQYRALWRHFVISAVTFIIDVLVLAKYRAL
jgi:hypothetical protein